MDLQLIGSGKNCFVYKTMEMIHVAQNEKQRLCRALSLSLPLSFGIISSLMKAEHRI